MSRGRRFAVYGLLGVAAEVAFTGLADVRRSGDLRLRAHTTLWSLPIYGLLQPLYEPLHDTLRGRAPAPVRGLAYGIGILAVEYASGRTLRRLLGQAPWDYTTPGGTSTGSLGPTGCRSGRPRGSRSSASTTGWLRRLSSRTCARRA